MLSLDQMLCQPTPNLSNCRNAILLQLIGFQLIDFEFACLTAYRSWVCYCQSGINTLGFTCIFFVEKPTLAQNWQYCKYQSDLIKSPVNRFE